MIKEELEHYLDLISIHKKALEILAKQITIFQAFVPPYIQMDYDYRIEEVKNLIFESKSLIPDEYHKETNILDALLSDFIREKIPEVILAIQTVLVRLGVNNNEEFIFQSKIETKFHENNIPAIKQSVEDLIATGDTRGAINCLVNFLKGKQLYDECILISARFEILQKDYRIGILNKEESAVDINNINNSILSILKLI